MGYFLGIKVSLCTIEKALYIDLIGFENFIELVCIGHMNLVLFPL